MTEEEAKKLARAAMFNLFEASLSKAPDSTFEEDGKTLGRYRVKASKGEIRMILPTFTLDAPVNVTRQSEYELSESVRESLKTREVGEGNEIVGGIGSSSSVDWYGTEMSLEALTDMNNQFKKGVSFFPRHGGFLDTIEWSEEFGRTIDAVVAGADVTEAFDSSEQGFTLEVFAELYTSSDELARKLSARLSMNPPQPIGMSIGGWFLEMTFIRDEESGDVLRTIIHQVLLDHIATVRNPANPDSTGLKLVRDVANEAILSIRAGLNTPAVSADPVIEAADEADTDTDDVSAVEARDTDPDVIEDSGSAINDGSVRAPNPLDDASCAGEETNEPVTTKAADEGEDMTPEQIEALMASMTAITNGQATLSARLDAVDARDVASANKRTADAAQAVIDAEASQVAADAASARATADAATAAGQAEDAEKAALQARVKTLEAKVDNRDQALSNLVGGSNRRGLASFTNSDGEEVPVPESVDDIGPFVRSQLDSCKSEDIAPALRAAVTRQTVEFGGKVRSAFDARWKAKGDKPGTEGGAFRAACGDSEAILRTLCRAAAADGTGRQWIKAAQN